jgi:pimeloyl-ACP methyl ester carboxylesterase
MIDSDAYVPLVRGLAEAGVAAALVDVPYRLAPTRNALATLWDRLRAAHADLSTGEAGDRRGVMIGGHSRGARLASEFVAAHPDVFAGLAIVGSTHPRDRDLSRWTMPVLKILGSEDCVAPVAGARANAALLPPLTRWVEIPGANHRQFGYYGWQLGDCPASISRAEQHRLTVELLLSFLQVSDGSNAPGRL